MGQTDKYLVLCDCGAGENAPRSLHAPTCPVAVRQRRAQELEEERKRLQDGEADALAPFATLVGELSGPDGFSVPDTGTDDVIAPAPEPAPDFADAFDGGTSGGGGTDGSF